MTAQHDIEPWDRSPGGGPVRRVPERRQPANEPWTLPLVRRGQWRSDAACRFSDPEMFFPISDSGPAQQEIAKAKAVCATCQVWRECLGFALRTRQIHGIWGGMTEYERAAARRKAISKQPLFNERRPA
jgi:WhiB family transcriptional regulator, redox-sensing transcriptional regulator